MFNLSFLCRREIVVNKIFDTICVQIQAITLRFEKKCKFPIQNSTDQTLTRCLKFVKHWRGSRRKCCSSIATICKEEITIRQNGSSSCSLQEQEAPNEVHQRRYLQRHDEKNSKRNLSRHIKRRTAVLFLWILLIQKQHKNQS